MPQAAFSSKASRSRTANESRHTQPLQTKRPNLCWIRKFHARELRSRAKRGTMCALVLLNLETSRVRWTYVYECLAMPGD